MRHDDPVHAATSPQRAVWTARELRDTGATRREISAAMELGRLVRIRAGWYAAPHAHSDVVAAVQAGGSLTCAGALRRHGAWVLEDHSHVRIAPRAAARSLDRRVHHLPGRAVGGVDDVATALGVAARCLPLDSLVAVVDSCLHQRLIHPADSDLCGTSTGRRALELADARAESGLESLGRIRLRRLGLRVTVQARINGVGRVDLLVGDRLVVEFDGDRWHSTAEQREQDRRRDAILVSTGRLVIRAGYERTVHQWPVLEQQILAIVHRDDHLWRRAQRTAVHGFG